MTNQIAPLISVRSMSFDISFPDSPAGTWVSDSSGVKHRPRPVAPQFNYKAPFTLSERGKAGTCPTAPSEEVRLSNMLRTNCVTDCCLLVRCCSLPGVWREWGGRLILMFIVLIIHFFKPLPSPSVVQTSASSWMASRRECPKVYIVSSIWKYEINKCAKVFSLFT